MREFGADMVFIVGSPRSGTTWMQRLLACHPLVATGQESSLFESYIGPQLRAWQRDVAENSGRMVGLGCHLREEDFLVALREYMQALMQPMRAATPEGGLFVEKTPSHALFLPEISQLLSQARVIHVVRDVRDVVRSILTAARSWGADWAPADARQAARMWSRHVNAALAGGREMGPKRFCTVRYEDLMDDTHSVLARVCRDFLGVAWDDEGVAKAVARNSIRRGLNGKAVSGVPLPLRGEWAARLEQDVVPEPEGFVGYAPRRLGPVERYHVWREARRAMERAGYAKGGLW